MQQAGCESTATHLVPTNNLVADTTAETLERCVAMIRFLTDAACFFGRNQKRTDEDQFAIETMRDLVTNALEYEAKNPGRALAAAGMPKVAA